MDFKVQLKENAVVMRNELPCRICSMRVPLPPQFRRVKTAICPSCAHEGLDKIVTIRLFKEQIVYSVTSYFLYVFAGQSCCVNARCDYLLIAFSA